MLKKRKASTLLLKESEKEEELTTEDNRKKLIFLTVWTGTLNWNIKHYLSRAISFFTQYPFIQEEIQQFRKEHSKIYFIPYSKLVYFFLTNISNKKHKMIYNHFAFHLEDYYILSTCKYILLLLGKKHLDPNEKKMNQLIWPCFSLPLSYKEVLFYYFIFYCHIVHFVQTYESFTENWYLSQKNLKIPKTVFKNNQKKKISRKLNL